MDYQFEFLGSALNSANYLLNLVIANQFQSQIPPAVTYDPNLGMNGLPQSSFNAGMPLGNELVNPRGALLGPMHGMRGDQGLDRDRGQGFDVQIIDKNYRNTLSQPTPNNQEESMRNINSQGANFPPQGGHLMSGAFRSKMISKETDFPSSRDRMPDYLPGRDLSEPNYSLRQDSRFPPGRDIRDPDIAPVRDQRDQDFPSRREIWDLETPPVRDSKRLDFPPSRDIRDTDILSVRDHRGLDFPPRNFKEPSYLYDRDSREPDFSTRRGIPEAGLRFERDRASYSPQRASPDSVRCGSSGRIFQEQPDSFRKGGYPEDPYDSRGDRPAINRSRLYPRQMESGLYSSSEAERLHGDLSREVSGSRSQERLQPDLYRTKFPLETRKRGFPDELERPDKRTRFDFDVITSKERESSPHRSYRGDDRYGRREYSPGRLQRSYDVAEHKDLPYSREMFDPYPGVREKRDHSPYTQHSENFEYRGLTSHIEERQFSSYPDKGGSFERGNEPYPYKRPEDDQKFDLRRDVPSSSNKQHSDHSDDYPGHDYPYDDMGYEDMRGKYDFFIDGRSVEGNEIYEVEENTNQGIKLNLNTAWKKAEKNGFPIKPLSYAIVPQGYPEKASLTRVEVEEAKNVIIDLIYQLDPKGSISPRFCASIYSAGALIVKALDNQTGNWLSKMFNGGDIRLSNGKKLLFRSAKITRRDDEVVVGLFPKYDTYFGFLKTLGKANPGIDTSCWSVVGMKFSKFGPTVSIRIPKSSVVDLEKNNYLVLFQKREVKLTLVQNKKFSLKPQK